MTDDRAQFRNDVEHAVCGPGEKLSPDGVPVAEFTGAVKMPATEGKTLLIFKTENDGSVGVRLEDDELEKMARNLEGFR